MNVFEVQKWIAWFNPNDMFFVNAYHELITNGQWPKEYKEKAIQDNIPLPDNTDVLCASIFASAWVKHMFDKHKPNE